MLVEVDLFFRVSVVEVALEVGVRELVGLLEFAVLAAVLLDGVVGQVDDGVGQVVQGELL